MLGLQDGNNSGIQVRHENPITGSYGISFSHGTFFNKTQEDPMGINDGLTDPFEEQVEFEPDLMLAKGFPTAIRKKALPSELLRMEK